MAKRKYHLKQVIFWCSVGIVGVLTAGFLISDIVKATFVTLEDVSENIKSSDTVKNAEELAKQFEEIKKKIPDVDWEKEFELDSVLDNEESLELFYEDEWDKREIDETKQSDESDNYSYSAEIPTEREGTLIKVIDGDTLLMNIGGKETRVRFIGVDTPESVAPSDYAENTAEGKDIANILSDMITEGETLSLEYDTSSTDKYGRTLAYVYFPNGDMIQDWLLCEGYAQTMSIEPDVRYSERFEQEEKTAKEKKIGFWNGYFKEDK